MKPSVKSWTALACLALAGMPIVSGPAAAQTLQEVEARQQAVVEAWEKTPLTARRAVFVTAPATIYGAFQERPSNTFKSGEPLYSYVEPVGYAWKSLGNGEYAFGLTVDFTIKRPNGQVLGGQEKFLNYAQTSRYRNQEVMVNLTLTISGAPPGDYIVTYTMRDANSAKTATIEQPFKIVN
ncbi:MAG TPA: hypothetical protein VIL65_09440 [Beijerinckiaceae bacterium]|jgi:hypothetical protein